MAGDPRGILNTVHLRLFLGALFLLAIAQSRREGQHPAGGDRAGQGRGAAEPTGKVPGRSRQDRGQTRNAAGHPPAPRVGRGVSSMNTTGLLPSEGPVPMGSSCLCAHLKSSMASEEEVGRGSSCSEWSFISV